VQTLTCPWEKGSRETHDEVQESAGKMPAAQRARRPRYVRGIGIFLLEGLKQGGRCSAEYSPSEPSPENPPPFSTLIWEGKFCLTGGNEK
jgi:hypothetical protein